jgi:hypothetical protein
MFSGNMSSLLALSAREPSDLLLPLYVRRKWDRDFGGRFHPHPRKKGEPVRNSSNSSKDLAYDHWDTPYHHWDTHEELLDDYPTEVSTLAVRARLCMLRTGAPTGRV